MTLQWKNGLSKRTGRKPTHDWELKNIRLYHWLVVLSHPSEKYESVGMISARQQVQARSEDALYFPFTANQGRFPVLDFERGSCMIENVQLIKCENLQMLMVKW